VSDLRDGGGPDLHAIFGIDGAPAAGDGLISVGRGAESELAAHSTPAEISLDVRAEPGFEEYGEAALPAGAPRRGS
jgi:hypothetical protein